MDAENSTKEHDVLEVVKETEQDLSIREIAEELPYGRDTISKYVHLLVAKKKLKHTRTVGRAKLYTTR